MAWQTHEISNQFDELTDYNLFATDAPLREALARAGADWAAPQMTSFGDTLGKAETWKLGADANKYKPEFEAFDARGRRIDTVTFHPSWRDALRIAALISSTPPSPTASSSSRFTWYEPP